LRILVSLCLFLVCIKEWLETLIVALLVVSDVVGSGITKNDNRGIEFSFGYNFLLLFSCVLTNVSNSAE
jgi:hypothetical protein